MASSADRDAIEIWRIDLDAAALPVDVLWQDLSLAAVGLPVAGERWRRTAHQSLRLVIGRHIGFDAAMAGFVIGPGGKPELPGHAIDFSLAHCGPLALVAVSRCGPVGVDVEAARAFELSDARRAVLETAAIEVADGCDLAAIEGDARTLQAWVRLEAVAKASGEGIGSLLERLDVRPGRARPGTPATGTPPVAIAIDVIAGEGHVAAVAGYRHSLSELLQARVRSFPADTAAILAAFGRSVR